MNFKRNHIILLLIIGTCYIAEAQLQFTLKNVIDTAMLNNFDIQIARNYTEIARMNNSFGMAGGLPTVNATAGDNLSLSNIDQKFADGTASSVTNRGQNDFNAGINAGIVLFNGFRITATHERLKRLEELSEIQLNQQIQNIMADIMVTYYDIVRQQNYLKIIENTLEVSNQKLEILDVKNKVGMADAAEMLQAQSDVNSAEQQLELQKLLIEQNKSDLLQLISARKQHSFQISDSIQVDRTLQLDSILGSLNRNTQLLTAEQQIQVNEQLVKEVSAQRYPSVKLNAGYDFYQADINSGNTLLNRNYGPSAGLSLQIPIFNGTIYKTQADVARINVTNARLEKENLTYSLQTQATKLYRSYSTTLKQIELQKDNFAMNKKLLSVVMQQFHLGQATILDVKAAQTSFENAAYLLVNLTFSAKVAEIELKQLTYSLDYQ